MPQFIHTPKRTKYFLTISSISPYPWYISVSLHYIIFLFKIINIFLKLVMIKFYKNVPGICFSKKQVAWKIRSLKVCEKVFNLKSDMSRDLATIVYLVANIMCLLAAFLCFQQKLYIFYLTF